MAANWSEIPEELVDLVAEQLVCVDDFRSIRYGVVCKPWKRAVSIVKKEQQVFAPLIMLAKADNDNLPTTTSSRDAENDEGKCIRSFIIPYGGQQGEMRSFDLELPKAQGRRCWGSPYGWVVTIGVDLEIHILNPLTGVQLPLPSQPNLQQQSNKAIFDRPPARLIRIFTRKFVLGWNPSSEEFMVMAIFGMFSEVAFTTTCMVPKNRIEAASSSWRRVKSVRFIVDVIFYCGMIFMIDGGGNLSFCDIGDTTLKAYLVLGIADIIENAYPKEIQVETLPRYYLVDICGRLHLVARFFQRFTGRKVDCYSQTKCFQVYRFNSREISWYHVPDLGEYALFVGNHTSFALDTTTYTDFSSNSIYFTDDNFEGYESPYCDTGVFNYKEGTIEKFDFTNHGTFSKLSRPIFFMPVL